MGLGFKFKRFPYVTALLCFICIGVYFRDPAHSKAISEKIIKIYEQNKLGSLQSSLFKDFCTNEGGEIKPCEEVAQVIEESYAKEEKHVPSAKRKVSSVPEANFVDDSTEALRYELIFSNFEKNLKKPNMEFQRLTSFTEFEEARDKIRRNLASLYKKENLLSASNLSPRAVLEAQFTHGSFMHLFGNILFLFLFGAYVEQRMSKLSYVGVYLLGGTVGTLTQVLIFGDPEQFLVGASANVSAVMGLFYVFFFRFRMKFLLALFPVRALLKTFYAPVAYAFPLLYILGELTQGLQSLDAGGGVAHFAHLAGLVVGAYSGFLLDSFHPVPWPFLYDSEKKDFDKLKAQRTLSEKLSLGEHILGYNHQNSVVRYYLIAQCFEAGRKNPNLDSRVKEFMRLHLVPCVEDKMNSKKMDSAFQLLAQAPVTISFLDVLLSLDPSMVIRLGDFALEHDDMMSALRFYDVYVYRFPKTRKTKKLLLTVDELLKHLPQNAETRNQLIEYMNLHENSRMIAKIKNALEGDFSGRSAS